MPSRTQTLQNIPVKERKEIFLVESDRREQNYGYRGTACEYCGIGLTWYVTTIRHYIINDARHKSPFYFWKAQTYMMYGMLVIRVY